LCGFQGYGVFALKRFDIGDFLLEYSGTLADPDEDVDDETFRYYFSLSSKKYWS